AVAEDHSVGPMGVVLIELCLRRLTRQSVEISEEINLRFCGFGMSFGAALQVVDQHFRVNLFLNIERWRGNNQVRPVLLVFAAPNELWIEVTVAAFVSHSNRA